MRTSTSLSFVGLLLVLSGCGDDASSTTGGTGGATGVGGQGSGAGGPGSGGATGTGGATGSGGAPPSCDDVPLAERAGITSVDVGQVAGKAIFAESPTGAVVAWGAADGLHLTPLDENDQRAGEDLVIEGSEPFGLAPGATDIAVLVTRPPDFMSFVRIDLSGAVLASADLVGGGDHQTEGVEWFGEFARTGRLIGRADGTYAAYFALHRRWPDGIGHQGDTLRLLDASGAPLGGWGWGCSHSMDQRIVESGGALGPICISDCYPGKGIYFNHNAVQIVEDPAANCAGGFNTQLGGVVAASDGGFWLSYGKPDGVVMLAKLGAAGAVESEAELPAGDTLSHKLGRYSDHLLVGRSEAGSFVLEERDASGAVIGAPATVPGLVAPAHDFSELANGDVGWAWGQGQALEIARVRACTP